MKTEIMDWINSNDRAVSPVIGVILMVAITVILAAVIGTFVLDLGQSAGNSAPQASLSVDTNIGNQEVTIDHEGGDGLDSGQTRVILEIAGSESSWDETGSDVFAVGDTVTITTGSNADSISGWGHGSANTDNIGSDFSKGDQISVTLIDVESQRVIFETTVTA